MTPAPEKLPDNPWRESLENCANGDNFLRCQEWHDLIAELDRLYTIEALRAEAAPLAEGREWRPLFDSQWVNIVNHDRCYADYSKEEAVDKAVKLTETMLRMNNATPTAQRVAAGDEHLPRVTQSMIDQLRETVAKLEAMDQRREARVEALAASPPRGAVGRLTRFTDGSGMDASTIGMEPPAYALPHGEYALYTHPAAQSDAREDYLPDGTRVLWESSVGNRFPGTITGYNPASYNCRLDDGCEANGYARGRFTRAALAVPVAVGGGE